MIELLAIAVWLISGLIGWIVLISKTRRITLMDIFIFLPLCLLGGVFVTVMIIAEFGNDITLWRW